MKKIIIFLFCLLVFINYTNAEVLIGEEEGSLPQSRLIIKMIKITH